MGIVDCRNRRTSPQSGRRRNQRHRGGSLPLIVVTSAGSGEGKTGVAAAIAQRLAYAGRDVELARAAADGSGPEDAAYFASLEFAPRSRATTVEGAAVSDPGPNRTLVLETSADTVPDGATVVAVSRGGTSIPSGVNAAALVVVLAAVGTPETAGDVPIIAIPEDRTLAGFSVSEARALLRAEVLVEGDNGDPTCDYLVIAPIGSDAGQPYFRRFESQAVVGRFDKTDMHLAAIRAEPNVLILSGGRHPSDYVFDAAKATGTPVLLSATDTENTVIALEGVWDRTRFRGERKLERMAELLGQTRLFEILGI